MSEEDIKNKQDCKGKEKHENANIRWDKKRLAIELIRALVISIVSGKIGASNSQVVYNGNVITYEIYSDTVETVKEINQQNIEVNKITGSDVANFAMQFEGNSYAYGGTSLTQGADTSGFVSAVYANFGIAVPHSSRAIAGIGVKVDAEDIREGDIVCYENHVGIYIGNSQIIHAASPRLGITVSDMYYRNPTDIRRIIN